MSRKLSAATLAGLGLIASANSHATLFGATVTETNAIAPGAGGTYVIGDGIERSTCVFPPTGTCLFGTSVDYGADYIIYRSFNLTDFPIPAGAPNTLTHIFDDSVHITGVELLYNTAPLTIELSFTRNTITYQVSAFDAWPAQSSFENRVAVTMASVPEPATLSLLAAGLLGTLAGARRRRRQ